MMKSSWRCSDRRIAHKASCFEDQYLSTGGQLYELIAGRDRFIADLRPLLASVVASRGLPPALCCHPYDICTALIAQECGVLLSQANGEPIDAPFDVDADVAWVGYANESIRASVEPALRAALLAAGCCLRSRRGAEPISSRDWFSSDAPSVHRARPRPARRHGRHRRLQRRARASASARAVDDGLRPTHAVAARRGQESPRRIVGGVRHRRRPAHRRTAARPAALAAWFAEHHADRWAAYVIGVVQQCVLRASIAAGAGAGMRISVESTVPEGKGVELIGGARGRDDDGR